MYDKIFCIEGSITDEAWLKQKLVPNFCKKPCSFYGPKYES